MVVSLTTLRFRTIRKNEKTESINPSFYAVSTEGSKEHRAIGEVLHFDDALRRDANLLAARAKLVNVNILKCLSLSYLLPNPNTIHRAAGTTCPD